MGLTITLPPLPREEQQNFNLKRWKELCADPEIAKLDSRVETDRYGHIVMTPPPSPSHGSYQIEIGALLRQLMRGGRVISECPLSTSDGVKAADVAWISKERLAPMERKVCFVIAPELCVEILSPSNSPAEMDEKKALYFEAGADEVWICAEDGAMAFFSAKGAAGNSALCPEFPLQVKLP